jgi:hypothetical protein
MTQRPSHRGCKNGNCRSTGSTFTIYYHLEKRKAHMRPRMANLLNLGCICSVLNNGTKNMTVRKMLMYLENPELQFH